MAWERPGAQKWLLWQDAWLGTRFHNYSETRARHACPQAGSVLARVAAPLFPADALEAVPLYAPGGALLPTKLAAQYVGDRLFNPLTLLIFPAGSAAAKSGAAISKCARPSIAPFLCPCC